MSRTISDLDLGTEITLQESGVDTSYILIRKDSYGCVLLRALCAGSRRMNPTNAVYEGSETDDYLVNEETGFLSRFDSGTIATLASRSISTRNYGDTEYHSISRKCYLLSYGELYGSTPSATEPDTSVLPALMIFKGTSDSNTARTSSIDGHTAVYWWLRSPYSAANFYNVYINGSGNNSSASNAGYALRPALNVAPATVVSEIADKIYLVAPSDPIKKVQFHGKVLETQLRPKKALVQYNAVNLSNIAVEVTNNYGDPVPVWVDATGQTEVALTNNEKQTTNWQLGVKCYGESYGYGFFEEPIVLAEVE